MTASKLAQAKTANAELPSLAWWKSKVFVGGVIAVLATLAQKFGLVSALTPDGQDKIADIIVALLQGGGGLMAALSRLTQKAAPPIKAL